MTHLPDNPDYSLDPETAAANLQNYCTLMRLRDGTLIGFAKHEISAVNIDPMRDLLRPSVEAIVGTEQAQSICNACGASGRLITSIKVKDPEAMQALARAGLEFPGSEQLVDRSHTAGFRR